MLVDVNRQRRHSEDGGIASELITGGRGWQQRAGLRVSLGVNGDDL